MVFGLHKHYLEALRPNRKTLRIAETIDWVCENLKSQYGVPNFIRLSKETEQPPESATTGAPGAPAAQQVQPEFMDEDEAEVEEAGHQQAGQECTD
jgi:hypothetical protein